jgi:alpha-tubulin suppressor-like RCC1 family protein
MGLPIPCQFPSANTKIKFVASGLHTAACIDMSGNVYFTGPNEDGSMGNGTTTGYPKSFVQVTTDSLGNPFTNVVYLRMASAIFTGGVGYGAIIYAIKSDGTLWVWGNTQGGYRGDGTYGRVNTRPVQVAFPAGTVITKVMVQNIAIALDNSGKVWTWGGNGGNNVLLGDLTRADYEHPAILSLPGSAKDIAGGGLFSYALLNDGSLYGWGLFQGYMGVGAVAASGYAMTPKPMLLNTSLNLPNQIAKISANQTTTYAILTDGSLWAWGGSECGQVGNGLHIDYSKYTVNPAPYGGTLVPYAWNWDMSTAQCQQHKPVNIAPGINNFVELSEGVQAVFYEFAVDANGQLYSWGRNKYGVLANGVMDANYINGTIGSVYPNSWDVPYITAINPFSANKTIQSTSPYCITNPTANGCSVYAIPANTPPKAVPGADQTVTGSTAKVDGSGSTDNVAIVYYLWSQVSGPNNAIISIPSGPKANLMGLVNGVYKFKLRVTDDGWMSDSSVVTITVNSSGAQPPVASAGSDKSITLPTNSVSLVGSGSEVGGAIASFAWTQVSGPSTATFGSGALATTTVSNLVQGVYKFQLTVKDLLGITITATVQVTVNPAPAGPPSANAGVDQTITLPTSSLTLTGSGSETNGTIATYAWMEVSGPSTAVFSAAGQASTGVSGLVQGVYNLQLTVKDNSGVTATDQVKVTVNAAPVVPGPPVVDAGANQAITLPANSASLAATASETNGTIASYAWTQISGPSTATIGTAGQASTTVGGMVQGVYSFLVTVKDNSGVTATDQVKVTVNAAPVVPGLPSANGGSDQVITLPANSVTLTGSGSETNGTIVSYGWSQVSGPSTATLSAAGQASTGASGLVQGVYVFELTVKDNSNVTGTDVVKVTVNAAAPVPGLPVVDAGANQSITLPANSASLTATASETNGSIASYAWTQISGPSTATIGTAGQASTTVGGMVQGVYSFLVTVKDNLGVTATDQVKVTVNAAPVVPGLPSANAGSDQVITLPASSVTLTGSGSETNGTIVSYGWLQISGPSTATLSAAGQASTGVSGLVQGVYVFQLTVKDNSGITGTDVAKVTVNAAPVVPGPPSAKAGTDQTITLPTNSVTLTGSGSETNGTIVSYVWAQVSGPSTAAITDAGQAVTQVDGLEKGVYVFKLTVKDNSGVTATDQVQVTVSAAPVVPGPLSANAGSDQVITLPTSSVTLTGSGSETNGTIVSYGWSQISGPSTATFSAAGQASTGVSGLVQGVYILQLTVKDNSGVTATDQVKATVNPAVTPPPTPANQAPVANAGPDQTVESSVSSVALDGSASYDPDGSIAKYQWIQVSGRGGVTITNTGAVSPTVYGLSVGSYVFQLTVTDNSGATATDQVQVTMKQAAPTETIIANAGVDTSIQYPATLALLYGGQSSAVNTTITHYNWKQLSGPSTAQIATPDSVLSGVLQLEVGVYEFELTVSDDHGNTSTSTVKVTVAYTVRTDKDSYLSIYPNPFLGTTITLDGANSYMGKVGVWLYSISGSKVMQFEFNKSVTQFKQTIQVPATLGRGIYLLTVYFNGQPGKPQTYVVVKQ